MSNFEIVDKRGGRKEDPVAPAKPELSEDKSFWKSKIGYVMISLMGRNGPVIAGRACGIRSDGNTFCADWFFPGVWGEDLNWQEKAKERLDTFLNCDCKRQLPCAVHKMYIPQWQRGDIQRLEMIANSPLPEAVERMAIAEKAAAESAIVVPR